MSMQTRRQFLKLLGLGASAAVVPAIFLPSTKTVLDLSPVKAAWDGMGRKIDVFAHLNALAERHAVPFGPIRVSAERLGVLARYLVENGYDPPDGQDYFEVRPSGQVLFLVHGSRRPETRGRRVISMLPSGGPSRERQDSLRGGR
jgi:hypothetical protein